MKVWGLVYPHLEGISAKEKEREIHFPYEPKNNTFQLKCKVRFLDFSCNLVISTADSLNKTEISISSLLIVNLLRWSCSLEPTRCVELVKNTDPCKNIVCTGAYSDLAPGMYLHP